MNKHTLFCKLDSLVINLDEFIEKTTNYENRIDALLDIQLNQIQVSEIIPTETDGICPSELKINKI